MADFVPIDQVITPPPAETHDPGFVPLGEVTGPSHLQRFMNDQGPHTTWRGVLGAVERGAAPYATAGGLGFLAGGPAGAAAAAGAAFATDLASLASRGAHAAFGTPVFPGASELVGRGLDALGVARPQTGLERVAETTAGGLAGGLGLAKGAEAVANSLASPALRGAAAKLAASPGTAAVSGAGAGAAQQTAAELGVGAPGQFVAGMVGGGLGGMVAAEVAPFVANRVKLSLGGASAAEVRAAQAATLQDKAVQVVLRKIAQSAKGGGPTAQDMLDLHNLTPSKPLALVDLGDENVLALGGKMARSPGAARQTMTNFLNARDEGAGTRLSGDVDQALGSGSAYDMGKSMSAARAVASAPKYQIAFAEPVSLADVRPVHRFIVSPTGQKALEKALVTIAEEHLADGTPFDPATYGMVQTGAVAAAARTAGARATPFETVPDEPLGLADFLHSKGGVKDTGGDVRHILGGAKYPPGLVHGAGLSLDDAALTAWEHGYFPEHGEVRPSINDLLVVLEDDLKGKPRYSADQDMAVERYTSAVERNKEIDRLAAGHGIDPAGLTREQFYAQVAAKANGGIAPGAPVNALRAQPGQWVINPDILDGKVAPSMRMLDAVKRGYDHLIDEYRDSLTNRVHLDEYGRALNGSRAAYVRDLRERFPKYAAALDAWSGPSRSMESLRLGQKFHLMRPEQVRDEFAALGDADKEFFKLGVADHLRLDLAKKGAAADEAKAIIGSDYKRSQLRPLFDTQEQYDSFINSVKAEARMFGSRYSVLQGSQTAARMAEDRSPDLDAYAQLGRGVGQAASGNHLHGILNLMGGIRNLLARPSPTLHAAIAKLLTDPLNGPDTSALRLLQGFNMGGGRPPVFSQFAAPTVARSLSPTVPAAPQPVAAVQAPQQ